MKCKICQSESHFLFPGRILGAYNISYFQCEQCGFIETEYPFWLTEALEHPISDLDTGLVDRNRYLSTIVANLLKHYFPGNQFLDFGGGYGLFTRMMRDKGYNFYRYDPFCPNIFANHFDISDLEESAKQKYAAITSFEVLEHLSDPVGVLAEIFQYSDTLICTTELQPKRLLQKQEDWWYFLPETGQHISLYSHESMLSMANRFHKQFYSDGVSIHIFTDKHLRNDLLRQPWYQRLINKMRPTKKSLIQADYEFVRNKLNQRSLTSPYFAPKADLGG